MLITFNFFEIFGILCLAFICSMLVVFIGHKITCWYKNRKSLKKQAKELADFVNHLEEKKDWELETSLKFYQKNPKYRKPEYPKLIKAEIQSRKQTDEAIFQAQLQNASDVALEFNNKLALTGVIMSKLDGDSKGGSALSIAELTHLYIKFIGVGEKISDLDIFYPDRMASRILGMGDVVSLVEKVKSTIDEREAKKEAMKALKGQFTLDDMLKQLKQIQKMGSLSSILSMLPGMPKITDEQKAMAEQEMKNFEVIMDSMTLEERANPDILKNSRKIRIAKGCGKTSADINRMLKKYEQAKMMFKQMKSGGFKGFPPFGGGMPRR